MNKTYLKKIKILEDRNIQLIYKEEQKILVIKKNQVSKYIVLPNFLTITKNQNFLLSKLTTDDKEKVEKYLLTNVFIETAMNRVGVSFKKKLILKGLGYRMTFVDDSKRINFKLGYSHLKNLEIPKNIKVKLRKNTINVESLDKNLLGNYVSIIRNLRSPDSYKGKGFRYKYEKEKLKEIKKK